MTTAVERRALTAYLAVLNSRLDAAASTKARIQDFRSKEKHEASSVATPFRPTSEVLGSGDMKMLRAVEAYAKKITKIRDSLKSFLDSTAEVDSEHGGQVSKETDSGQVWTI
ncbi:hypothetical protein [Mycobacteroides abscessus]|uniref:hypothetical protein n=1 Tax=Mycobacteroides abscessus TaxID=36809 RepID=UPI0009269115|nr:hypothetical protein [Mycobacteroides abscessus]SHQ50046.1 Uncharacterised protein [Mycobacteroides abscessus subsp. abscessus]SKQ83896.1 Uncharacterised protein [Mycobacteroides abscessus subsp. massiliense]SLC49717.1 Uncharacterised protein [Mycobacteroides abscessus subsp. massiliense]